jgi:putative nucleotidyltransferase with HDIG domain
MNTDLQTELRRRVVEIYSTPSAPVVLQPLLDILRKPAEDVNVDRVIKLVSYDQSIAAQCLRVANSPLYGRVRTTQSIRAAVVSLGIDRVEHILLSCCMNRLIPDSKWCLDPGVFWRHSFGCALVCRQLAQQIGYVDPEHAYLAGLLHDLGILVNSLAYTEKYRSICESAAQTGMALDEAESSLLGFTHSESGTMLAESWRIPLQVVEVIEFHHQMERAPVGNPLVALVHLGDLLCRLRGLGYGYSEWKAVDLAADPAWQILAQSCPRLSKMDMARFTLDLDVAVVNVSKLVDTVFAPVAMRAR